MQLHYIFCLFFFCSTSLFLKSQTTEWAPPGAHWYFCQGTGLGSPNCGGYFYQEVSGDTVVAGQACRKLSVYQKDWQNKITVLNNRYTFSRNDSVYFYQPDSNRFLLTYDFTAAVGDTLEFPTPSVTSWEPEDTSFRVRVDSIVWWPAGQDTLRFFYVSPLEWENWGFYSGWYAEKIGGKMMFTPFPTVTIPEVDGFIRCYADDSAFIQLSLVDCDFTSGISDPEPFALEVFPNPAVAQLTIRLDGPGTGRSFTLYNALGQVVRAGDLPDSLNNISTSGIPAGVYVLRVWAKGGTIVRKIWKT